jgi:predicted branched-subunit amino acid permease
MSAAEAGLTSASVFAGAAQFVALDLWRDPVPWLLLTVTVFIVNIRHVLMGASLARHMDAIPRRWQAALMFLMADENWAFAERRALTQPLTTGYYLGLALPMIATWVTSTLIGAIVGGSFGDPAAIGFDFAFSALFIGILAGFWKGPRTGAVLGASAIVAAAVKFMVPGAWYIVSGGIAGVFVAALLHAEQEIDGP